MINKEIYNIKKVKTEDEYWKAHKIITDEIKTFTLNVKRLAGNPEQYLNDYHDLMKQAVRIGVLSKADADGYIKKLYDGLSKPSKWKEWVKNKIIKAEKKKLDEQKKKDL